jgi:hypothetical protein
MTRLGRSPAVLVSVGLFLIFLAFLSGHLYSIDGLEYFRVAERIVFDRSLVFDPPLTWGFQISRPITPVGFSLVQVPAVLLAGWARPLQPAFGTALYDAALLYRDPVYTLASWVNPLVVALTGALTFQTAERLGAPRRAAMLIAIATILGSPLFFYARADLAQPLATLLLLGIVAFLIAGVQRRNVRPGLMTGAVALAILTRPVDGLLIAFVALVVLCLPLGDWRPLRDGRRLGLEVAIGALAGLAVMCMVDFIRFGDPLDFGYAGQLLGSLKFGLVAELVSPGRGLLWYFPLLALAPIGAWALWRRGLRHETVAMVLPVLIFLPSYAKFVSLGGWCWGPRYLVPLIPLLGLLAGGVVWPQRRHAPVLLFGLLSIAGGLANVAHLAVDPLASFWGVYGDDVFGTPGFWRQFEIGAYAPIGSWHWYDPVAGPDIMWLRLAGSTHGASIVVFLVLLLLGILALVRAWRLSGAMPRGTRGEGSNLPAGHRYYQSGPGAAEPHSAAALGSALANPPHDAPGAGAPDPGAA